MISIQKAYAVPTVKVLPYESGPKNPGDTFSVSVVIGDPEDVDGFVYGVHSAELTLKWNQRVLDFKGVSEGPFLSLGGPTFFVYAVGIAGESVTVGNLITKQSAASGAGTIFTVDFAVKGGGQTDLTLSGTVKDVNGNPFTIVFENGHFYSTYPYADFTYSSPVRSKIDMATIVETEGATFYYDDIVHFTADAYDVDGTVASVKWTFREGGFDYWKGVTKWTFTGPSITVSLPFRRVIYNDLLGWVKLTLNVTDNDGHSTILERWIRFYAHVPGETKMINIPHSNFKKSQMGTTMWFGGKVQNLAGTAWYGSGFRAGVITTYQGEEFLHDNIELGRLASTQIWTKIRFTIRDELGNIVAQFMSEDGPTGTDLLAPTETNLVPLMGKWDVTNVPQGTYTAKAKGFVSASGAQFVSNGITLSGVTLDHVCVGTVSKSFSIAP